MIKLKKSTRPISRIILHCTASREGQDWTVQGIRDYHVKERGWSDIGYHYVIYRDGSIHEGRDVNKAGAHTTGYNQNSIGVVYVGGVASDGRTPKDTRTPQQKEALHSLVAELQRMYPNASVHGHYEFAAKACPSFDVTDFLVEHLAMGKEHKCNLK